MSNMFDSEYADDYPSKFYNPKQTPLNIIQDIKQLSNIYYMQEQQQYDVEAIIAKKYVKQRPYYFIKWKGYSHEENTWEPLSHLNNVLHLVRRFEKKYPFAGEENRQKHMTSKRPRIITTYPKQKNKEQECSSSSSSSSSNCSQSSSKSSKSSIPSAPVSTSEMPKPLNESIIKTLQYTTTPENKVLPGRTIQLTIERTVSPVIEIDSNQLIEPIILPKSDELAEFPISLDKDSLFRDDILGAADSEDRIPSNTSQQCNISKDSSKKPPRFSATFSQEVPFEPITFPESPPVPQVSQQMLRVEQSSGPDMPNNDRTIEPKVLTQNFCQTQYSTKEQGIQCLRIYLTRKQPTKIRTTNSAKSQQGSKFYVLDEPPIDVDRTVMELQIVKSKTYDINNPPFRIFREARRRDTVCRSVVPELDIRAFKRSRGRRPKGPVDQEDSAAEGSFATQSQYLASQYPASQHQESQYPASQYEQVYLEDNDIAYLESQRNQTQMSEAEHQDFNKYQNDRTMPQLQRTNAGMSSILNLLRESRKSNSLPRRNKSFDWVSRVLHIKHHKGRRMVAIQSPKGVEWVEYSLLQEYNPIVLCKYYQQLMQPVQ